jgi:uncharacterized protein YndB with AHSA1/START domain
MAKGPTLLQRYYYAAPPAKVFAALSQPKQLSKWFLRSAEITPKKGTTFRFTWVGGYTMKGKVLAATAPKLLELEWNDQFPGKKKFHTQVQFQLRKRGKGTILTVTHTGFKTSKKWIGLYGAIESGWAYFLTNLRSVLEHGIDLRSPLDPM